MAAPEYVLRVGHAVSVHLFSFIILALIEFLSEAVSKETPSLDDRLSVFSKQADEGVNLFCAVLSFYNRNEHISGDFNPENSLNTRIASRT